MFSVCNLWDFFSLAFALSWSRQIVNFTYFSCKKHGNWKVLIKKVCGSIKNLYTCVYKLSTNKPNQTTATPIQKKKKNQKPKQNCQKTSLPSNNNKKASHTTCSLIEASCGLWWKEYLVLSLPVCGKWQCCDELSVWWI